MMTKDEMLAYWKEYEQFPNLEEMHKAPIGWFPTKPSNPSKLQAHKFVDGQWIPLCHIKFVPWPEKFPS